MKKMSKKRKTPLPRPETPCKAYYLLTGTQASDPRDARLLKVDWDGPAIGVAAKVEMNGKRFHLGLEEVIPASEETAQLVIELRQRIIDEHDAKTRAAELRRKLRKRSLLEILKSEG